MKTRYRRFLLTTIVIGFHFQSPSFAQGMEESADPNSLVPNNDGYDRAGDAMPALQGNVSKTAPQMAPPLPLQNYSAPGYFGSGNGFTPPSGYMPPPSSGFAPGSSPYHPNVMAPQMPPANFQTATPQVDKSPDPPKGGLFGGVLKSFMSGAINYNNSPPVERPWWIPSTAFTNESMVAPYHAMDIFWWDKRPIPDKPQMVRLSTSVSRYWRGYVAEPCFVLVEPDPRAPGNFTFKCRQPGGPRGWLQALDKPDPGGFPQYRYWLDQ